MSELFRWARCLLPFVCAPVLAFAENETELKDKLVLELNTAQSAEAACVLTFQAINAYEVEITKLVYETVLFNAEGGVDRLTLFDFGTLPPGRPRVRQFSVPGVTCDGLGRVLINGAQSCEGDGLAPGACETGLELHSRTEIEMAG